MPETRNQLEGMIDIAVVIGTHQRLIAGSGGADTNFLGSPVEIDAGYGLLEHHE